ncbi:MAG: hypothetical protein WHV67_05085 [Thermoanaerobaculia bacterium]
MRIFAGFLFASGVIFLSYFWGLKFKKYSEGIKLFLPGIYKSGLVWIFNYGLTILFPFSFLSSSISQISIFFKDKSLKLYRTFPLSDFNFFLPRAFKTFIISNGYIYFLIIPFIYGMSNFKSAFLSLFLLTIYLGLSFLLGMTFTFFLSYFFKISNLYKLFSFFFALLTIFVLFLFRTSIPKEFFSNPYLFFLQFQEPENTFYTLFLPLSNNFYNLIFENKFKILNFYLFSIVILFLISFMVFKILYSRAYSKSFSSKEGKKGIRFSKILRKYIFLNLLIKEWLSILRTPLRLTQTALMVSLIFLYFFNFQLLPFKEEPLMENVYKGLHLFLFSFILSALGLRFSFPSISLEGRSFYFFKIIPLSYEKFFFAKGFSYFLPFFLLSLIFNLTAFLNLPFNLNEKIFFLFYGFIFSLITSFGGVLSGSLNPQFKNPNPLQIGFSAEGLFYFFSCFLFSIFFTFYYIKDLLKLFI